MHENHNTPLDRVVDDVSDIKAMYDRSGDGEENRLERHQLGRDITLRFSNEYIPAGARVLEVGTEESMVASSRHLLFIGKDRVDRGG